MKVLEFESKTILSHYGIHVPHKKALIPCGEEISEIIAPVVVKVQTLEGKRGVRGGVVVVACQDEVLQVSQEMLDRFVDSKPYGLLFEEVMGDGIDVYVSFCYQSSGIILTVSVGGGTAIEEFGVVYSMLIDLCDVESSVRVLIERVIDDEYQERVYAVVLKAFDCFTQEDCQLLEINPLRITDTAVVALDCKMELDHKASKRHPNRSLVSEQYTVTRQKTDREKKVDEINSHPEYKGSLCRYVELSGDVALLLSGGGASLVLFDSVVAAGLQPGNYSEYSGNPTREKVAALTRVILSKSNQRGLLIAGGIANFTQVDETIGGILDVLIEVQPTFPIVIRRGGPGEERAQKMVAKLSLQYGLNITWLPSTVPLSQVGAELAQRLA